MKNRSVKVWLTAFAVVIAGVSGGNAQAQTGVVPVKLNSIPYPLEVINDPVSCTVEGNSLTLSAKGKTNLFNSPSGISRVQNAPMVLFRPQGDFTLSARVAAGLKSVYDVAALVIFQDEDTWAKYCYEYSVDKVPTMVSVVTRTYSDDCNSIPAGEYAYMSVVKKGEEFSFFYSADNVNWKLIRHFRLQLLGNLKAGFAVHGSRGDGLSATFTEIKYLDKALENMRNDN